MAEQTTHIRQFTCVVATTGRQGGGGMITMVTVAASDYADASRAVREAVAARFGCDCELLDIEPLPA